jgi:hypothetical protein
MLQEIAFRVQHVCPFNDLSRRYPKVEMSLWCDRGKEVVEIESKNPDILKEIQGDIGKIADIQLCVVKSGRILLIVKTCNCYTRDDGGYSITKLIDTRDCLLLPPIRFIGGWEHYKVISFAVENTKKLFEDISREGSFEILYKKPLREEKIGSLIFSADSLFSSLTGKQVSALVTAYEKGYYHIPRKTTTTAIAKHSNSSRTTLEEHLRKGENKLIATLIPYLKLLARER